MSDTRVMTRPYIIGSSRTSLVVPSAAAINQWSNILVNPAITITSVSTTNDTMTVTSGGANDQSGLSVGHSTGANSYYEVFIVSQSFRPAVGMGSSDVNLSVRPGISATGAGMGVWAPGIYNSPGSAFDSVQIMSAFTTNDWISCAYSPSLGLSWFRKNTLAWNDIISSLGTQDPATLSGGITAPLNSSTILYAQAGGFVVTDSIRAVFSSTGWNQGGATGGAPSGFNAIPG